MTVYRDVPLSTLPQGYYRTGLIDPPWKYVTYSAKGLGKSPDRHYNTMTIDQLKALPVRQLFRKDAVIFVWVIDSHVELAMDVIKHWQFKFRTVGFYWAKTTKDGSSFPIGTGKWTRANPEHAFEAWAGDEQEVERCFLHGSGHPKRHSAAVPRLIVSPRREHSRKPDETYDRIERLVQGPYLELFSRNDRPEWDCWGEEAGNFAIQQALARQKVLLGDPEAADLI